MILKLKLGESSHKFYVKNERSYFTKFKTNYKATVIQQYGPNAKQTPR